MELASYRRQLAHMTSDELRGEIHKLDRLLANLRQDHRDREDTLNMVLKEKEEAVKELSLRYIENKENEEISQF